MSHLVQILLPVYDNAGSRFPAELYDLVRAKLTDVFGGLTAHTRAPAEGLWDSGRTVKRDDIIVVESWSSPSIERGGSSTNTNSNDCSARTKSSFELRLTNSSSFLGSNSWQTIYIPIR
jgi:hypothetical protein